MTSVLVRISSIIFFNQIKKAAFLELLLKHSRDRDFYNYLLKLKKNGKFKLLTQGYNIEQILFFVAEILSQNRCSIEEITTLFLGINEKIDKNNMTFKESLEKSRY